MPLHINKINDTFRHFSKDSDEIGVVLCSTILILQKCER